MDYWTIYLFVKLDDVKEVLSQEGGLVFVSIVFLVITIFIKTISSEHDEEAALLNDALKSRGFKLSLWAFILSVVFTFTMNLFVTFIPSTGQMAAIYLGGKASQSDTAEILGRLPEKYAAIIEQKADEWLASQSIEDVVNKVIDKKEQK